MLSFFPDNTEVSKMIVMPRKTQDKLDYFDVLLRRGDMGDEEHVNLQLELYKLQLHSAAVKRVDRQWLDISIDGLLFHDYSCSSDAGQTYQMDTIFVCKHFLLILDIRNSEGYIRFNPYRRQFIRTKSNGKTEVLLKYFSKVKGNRTVLTQRLGNAIPIETAIVIGNPQSKIGHVTSNLSVIRFNELAQHINELAVKHKNHSCDVEQIKKHLQQIYTPIQNENGACLPIRKGVLCHKCNEVMTHSQSGFKCPKCNWRDQKGEALLKALNDYRLLFGPHISNQKFRAFCGVTHIQTANRMLKKFCNGATGVTKDRTYIIPEYR